MSVIRPFAGTPTNMADAVTFIDDAAEVNFGFSFRGYASGWVGNFGGITFQEPFDTTVSWDAGLDNRTPIEVWQFGHAVYPLWGEWDTRSTGSITGNGTVEFGAVSGGFAVTWTDVGINSVRTQVNEGDTRRNTFQVVIRPSGCIEFNYDKVEVDVGQLQYLNATLSGSYGTPSASFDPLLYWFHYPIVGWSLPDVGDMILPRPSRVQVFDTAPPYDRVHPVDSIIGLEQYLQQGQSGFTTGGDNSLAENTNCGTTGRWQWGPCTVPPLRQNQRDDARQNQRTSQQLTVRQRGYL